MRQQRGQAKEISSVAGESGADASLSPASEPSPAAGRLPDALPETVTPETRKPIFGPGEVLSGRFEVVGLLGRGGMGEVYEVQDRVLGTRVALKAVLPELAHSRKTRERFQREILLARKVSHRKVCRIFDLAADHNRERDALAFTMELLQGETLSQFLKRKKRLSTDEALPLIRQLSEGLSALHGENIVHRDFKPGNVILIGGREGPAEVKITDFGLARAVAPADSPGTASFSREVVGTPKYMAPEQLAAQPVGPSADIYALGLVMYRMVTGRSAYTAQNFADNVRQKAHPPAPPSTHVPNLDPSWNKTILRCLAVKPENRPRDLAEVVSALEAEAPVEAEPKPVPVPPRWPAITAAAVFAILLALAVLISRYPKTEDHRQRVAVLPIAAAGGDPGLQAFADGLTETITARLSRFEGLNQELWVVPSRDVRQPEAQTAAGAWKNFGVDYAVEGRLEGGTDRVRLVLNLVDARTKRRLESAVAEGSRANALKLQDDAVNRLSVLLKLGIQPTDLDRIAGVQSVAPGVHEFYLQGRGYLQRSFARESIEMAIQLFERALTADSRYALAHAGLGEAYWRLYERTGEPKWVEMALSSCQAASQLNHRLAAVQVTLGRVNSGTGKYEKAVRHFHTALAIDARDGEAVEGLAQAYKLMERFEDAEAAYRKAIRLRPGDWRAYHELGRFYNGRRQFEQAMEQFRRVVALTPDNAQAYLNLGAGLQAAGRLEEARANYERCVALDSRPRPVLLSNLGNIHFAAGRYPEAARRFEQAVELSKNDYRVWGNLASAYDHSGDPRTQKTYRIAADLVRKTLDVNPRREELHSRLAFYYAGAGDREQTDFWLAKAASLESVEPVEMARIAATCEKLGRREEAFRWAERALQRGAPFKELVDYRWLKPLLADPKFTKLAKRVAE